MDPLSAIGLASNILQFIEFGAELCVNIQEVASSATGSTKENEHIEVAVGDLESATDGLSTNVKGNNKNEVELVQLAGSCRALSAQLMHVLSKLRAKKGDGLFGSVRTAWKSTLKKSKIASIEGRLADYRAQLILRLNILLYDEQSPTKVHLKRIEQQALDLGNRHGAQMQAQHEQLGMMLQRLDIVHANSATSSSLAACQAAVEDMRTSLARLHVTAKEVPRENGVLRALYFPSMFHREDTISSAVGETYRWLLAGQGSSSGIEKAESDDEGYKSDTNELGSADHVSQDSERPQGQRSQNQQDISALWSRESSSGELGKNDRDNVFVPDSDLASHLPGWDYEMETSSRQEVASIFRQFLAYHNSVFFIHGKAGSGKSTLMKYLADAENMPVRQCLQAWKGGCHLIRVSVFFWNAGDDLQKSLEGLYRSILYQALRQLPEFVAEVFEDASDISDWQKLRQPVLDKAINKLIQTLDPQRHKLCLFIDGLDEYEGDAFDQVQLVKCICDWGRQENVKIVCSARPHQEYMQTLAQQDRHLPLHEFTKGDIFDYALTIFRESAGPFPSLPSFSILRLAHEVAILAKGVFLWAYLIVRSFSQKLQNYSAKQLHEMLLATPRNLDIFFDQMLENVDPLSHSQSELFLLLAAYCPFAGGLNAIAYSWVEDLKDPRFPFESPLCCYSQAETERRLGLAKAQIRDLTRGMLEVRPVNYRKRSRARRHIPPSYFSETGHPFYNYTVEFFHRTFRDYLLARWHDRQAPTADTYMRIALAEAKFSCTMNDYHSGGNYIPSGFRNLDTLTSSLSEVCRDDICLSVFYCKQIERVFEGYEELLNFSIPNRQDNLSRTPLSSPVIRCRYLIRYNWNDLETKPALSPFSFLGYLTRRVPVEPHYIIDSIKEHSNSEQSNSDLINALIWLARRGEGEDYMPYFMEKGVTPNSELTIGLLESDRVQPSTVSAWLAAIGSFTVEQMFGVEIDSRFWQIIETFLRVGADPDILFLAVCNDHVPTTTYAYRTEDEVDIVDEDKIRYLDLPQLMKIMRPPNFKKIQHLLDRSPARASNWWDGVARIMGAFSTMQEQPNLITEARSQYRKWSESDEQMQEIVELRTRNYRFPRNAIIQLY
ncbi:hypothetical protein BDV06DRAFT_125145 [Aspergillus oleicola]